MVSFTTVGYATHACERQYHFMETYMTQQVAANDLPRRPGRQPVLTAEIVESCRARLAEGGVSIAALAREHGVHPTTMRMACKGVTWNARNPNQMAIPDGMRRIPGYSAYFADAAGGIFSARQSEQLHQLTFGTSGRGYKVFLVADGARKGHTAQVHDLVCAAWHGERPSAEHRVLHSDGDRRNNAKDNLSWAEPGSVPRAGGGAAGEAHGRAKLTDSDVLEILAYGAIRERPADIARHKGVHPTTVSGILSRRLWSHVEIPADGLPAVERLPARQRAVPSGAAHGRAKLNDEQVALIRAHLASKTNAALAEEHGVHPTTIARIRKGEGWRNHA